MVCCKIDCNDHLMGLLSSNSKRAPAGPGCCVMSDSKAIYRAGLADWYGDWVGLLAGGINVTTAAYRPSGHLICGEDFLERSRLSCANIEQFNAGNLVVYDQ